MKIIFLDIDGVLNTPRFNIYQIEHHEADAYTCQFNFDPICMKNLKTLIKETNAQIVLTSSWRSLDLKDEYMQAIIGNFRMYKFDRGILSMTPNIGLMRRGEEIQSWLDCREKIIENYVILDDDVTDLTHLKDRLVQCDKSDGFNKEALIKALNILK